MRVTGTILESLRKKLKNIFVRLKDEDTGNDVVWNDPQTLMVAPPHDLQWD